MAEIASFEALVELYYEALFRFAFTLAGSEEAASDLTQETFYIWQTKGHQLLDPAKVKTWLFTTLHREFLNSRRRHARFPHLELDEAAGELPNTPAVSIDRLDGETALAALARVEEPHQAALALFYLEDYSYQEIAEILGIPIGTVKSRLARGIEQLKRLVLGGPGYSPAERKHRG
jgi:RNA polymerase sigma-70 factor (ECF subfamily)